MKRHFLPLLLPLGLPLVLGACEPSGNSPDAVCTRQSYQDPDVKLLIMKQAGNAALSNTTQAQLAQMEAQAKLKCLQAMGAVPPGGVEPHKATYRDETPF